MDEPPVVLLVDDDPTARDATASALADALPAVETQSVTDVATAQGRLAGTDPDAAVFEYDLPDGTGLDLLASVRERDPDIPVVLFTDSGDESVASRAISMDVTDYVVKASPDAAEEVARAVAEGVRRRRVDEDGSTAPSEDAGSRRPDALEADVDVFPDIVQSFGDPVYLLDGDGYLRAVNDAFEETFLYDRGTVLGEHLTEFMDEDTFRAATDRLLAVVQDEERRHVTVTFETERADGTGVVAEATATPLVEGRRLIGSVGTIRDVTERDRRERRLETYRELVETVSDPMFKLDVAGNVEMVNDAMIGFGRYDRDELLGRHFTEFLNPEDAEDGEAIVRRLLSDEGSDTAVHEFTLTTESGEENVVENSLTVLTDENGVYAGSVGVLRDVTDRKQRERELAQYETYIETVPVGMFAVDQDGVLTWTNEEAWNLFEIDPDTFQERYVDEPYLKLVDDGLLDFDHVEEYRDLVREMLSSETEKQNGVHDATAYPKNSDPRFLTAHTGLLPLEDGEYTGTVTAFRDITKQKEYERELERQNERLERFASVVSHDLRNPLNVAQGHLDAAKVADDPSSSIEEVDVSLNRMRELIDDVLALARHGESVADPAQTDLGAVVGEAWSTVDTQTATLACETSAAILADESRLRQLLENLFRNAVEHGVRDDRAASDDPARSVTVTVGDLDDGFYVEDDGDGVPDEEKTRVFDLGYSTESTGTGFGLGIVSEIVDAHGWDVDLVDADSGGARFEITGVRRADEV